MRLNKSKNRNQRKKILKPPPTSEAGTVNRSKPENVQRQDGWLSKTCTLHEAKTSSACRLHFDNAEGKTVPVCFEVAHMYTACT
jgi:hypothetical protein